MNKLILTIAAWLICSTAHANLNSVQSNGNVLSWNDTGGWIWVQDSNNGSVICRGLINQCPVPSVTRTYDIIDFDNNQRVDDVTLTQTVTPIPPIQPGSSTSVVYRSNKCGFYENDNVPWLMPCSATCPINSMLIGVPTCRLGGNVNQITSNPRKLYSEHESDTSLGRATCFVEAIGANQWIDRGSIIISVTAACLTN